MRDIIVDLFGTYSPLTDTEGNIIRGLSGIDMEWCASVLLFALCLWSLFKVMGVLFKKW